MDDIENRLRETSEHCFNCYEAWMGNKKDGKTREELQDAIHELRKVASRLEIEIAVSERDNQSSKRIKPPRNRSAGPQIPDDNGENKAPKVELKPRKTTRKKTADGES